MKQNRFKSLPLWSAIVAQLFAILELTGAFKALGLDMGVAGDVVASVLQLLVLFGILNNPTSADSF